MMQIIPPAIVARCCACQQGSQEAPHIVGGRPEAPEGAPLLAGKPGSQESGTRWRP